MIMHTASTMFSPESPGRDLSCCFRSHLRQFSGLLDDLSLNELVERKEGCFTEKRKLKSGNQSAQGRKTNKFRYSLGWWFWYSSAK